MHVFPYIPTYKEEDLKYSFARSYVVLCSERLMNICILNIDLFSFYVSMVSFFIFRYTPMLFMYEVLDNLKY